MRFACWLSEKPPPPPDAEPTRGFPAEPTCLSGPLRDYVRPVHPHLSFTNTLIRSERGHSQFRCLLF